MMKALSLVGMFAVLLAACTAKESSDKGHAEAIRAQCVSESNAPDSPCQISAYTLVSLGAPAKSEMYVDTVLFYPGLDARLFFVNEDAAEHEDYSSSFLVLGAGVDKLPKKKGFYRVVAKFNRDLSDHGVGSGVYRQAGTFLELVRVRPLVSISARTEECRQLAGCTIQYQDGRKFAE